MNFLNWCDVIAPVLLFKQFKQHKNEKQNNCTRADRNGQP